MPAVPRISGQETVCSRPSQSKNPRRQFPQRPPVERTGPAPPAQTAKLRSFRDTQADLAAVIFSSQVVDKKGIMRQHTLSGPTAPKKSGPGGVKAMPPPIAPLRTAPHLARPSGTCRATSAVGPRGPHIPSPMTRSLPLTTSFRDGHRHRRHRPLAYEPACRPAVTAGKACRASATATDQSPGRSRRQPDRTRPRREAHHRSSNSSL